jgi:hypothetical protein
MTLSCTNDFKVETCFANPKDSASYFLYLLFLLFIGPKSTIVTRNFRLYGANGYGLDFDLNIVERYWHRN